MNIIVRVLLYLKPGAKFYEISEKKHNSEVCAKKEKKRERVSAVPFLTDS